MERFATLYPQVSIRMYGVNWEAYAPPGGGEIEIRYGAGNWPGMEATQLISQDLRPYCSSSVLNRLRDAGGILSLPLIDVLGTPNGWNDWLERFPQGEPEHLQRFSVDSYAIAASMAVESAGICLLNEELLQGSRLREFLLSPLEQTIPSQASFSLVKQRDRPLSSAALAFTDWLSSELR